MIRERVCEPVRRKRGASKNSGNFRKGCLLPARWPKQTAARIEVGEKRAVDPAFPLAPASNVRVLFKKTGSNLNRIQRPEKRPVRAEKG